MVWRRLAALLIPGLLFAGCIGVDPGGYPISGGMGLGGWEVTNHFEKDSDNNRGESSRGSFQEYKLMVILIREIG